MNRAFQNGFGKRTIKMKIPINLIDAFTLGNNEAFTGNQAAVCVLERENQISDETRQKIAAEMNLSETAFITRLDSVSGDKSNNSQRQLRYSLRWFTPVTEVELCGHATLASAKVVFEELKNGRLNQLQDVDNSAVLFETRFKGTLKAFIDWQTNLISLEFPLNPPHVLKKSDHKWLDSCYDQLLLSALGDNELISLVDEILFSPGTKKLMLVLKSIGGMEAIKVMKKVKPNFEQLLQLKTDNFFSGILVTARYRQSDAIENPKLDFVSRYFNPWVGINEDPVTGSAHTVSAPYWHSRLTAEGLITGDTVVGRQCSTRTGDVHCTVRGDKVMLQGQARVMLTGQFLL